MMNSNNNNSKKDRRVDITEDPTAMELRDISHSAEDRTKITDRAYDFKQLHDKFEHK